MGEAFPVWEAASRWSQALEEVEESSRPFLEEVQRYERYRCLETCEAEGVDGSASQPPWAQLPALVSPPCTKSLPPFKPRPLTHWAPTRPPPHLAVRPGGLSLRTLQAVTYKAPASGLGASPSQQALCQPRPVSLTPTSSSAGGLLVACYAR